ncbi:hypothetical protein O1L68_41705 [Streptomyces lydicus]|nr:hypothetical protein [Streptomyces lydicus]MCZ1012226.1 hypothetical protein [Streptomyces lydicus]
MRGCWSLGAGGDLAVWQQLAGVLEEQDNARAGRREHPIWWSREPH